MRVVLDTNVWISGLLLPKSKAGAIIKKWHEKKLTVVISSPILKEIEAVLLYPKITKRIGWDKEEVKRYMDMLPFFTETVVLGSNPILVKKDPSDSPILSTLVESRANYLITGDKVLLEFHASYPVISVSEFYGML